MLRRLFPRDREAHRSKPPTVEAWASDGRVDFAVRNNDVATAVTPHLVLMFASGETSDYDRAELDLESIEPNERGVATVETDRRSVYRVWWFLTWQAAGAQQQASGSVNVG